MKSSKPLYRESHLQKQSDHCAYLWKNWYNYQFGLKDEEKAKKYRELWGKCVEKHTEMCELELETNPIYNMRPIVDK